MVSGRVRITLAPVWDSVLALVAALVFTMLLLKVTGSPPLAVLRGALAFSLFTWHGFINTLAAAIPLVFTGLCFLVGARAGVFNIGAEGVIMISAGAAVAVGAYLALPSGIHHVIILASAVAAGVLWMIPVAYLKIRRDVHEVLSTIMLNWVATFWLAFLIAYPLRDPKFPVRTVVVLPSGRVPPLIPGTSLTVMLFVAAAVAFGLYVFLNHTRRGLHVRASGLNPDAARAVGINVDRSILLSLLIGGGIAGLAGFSLTAGLPPFWYVDELMQTLLRVGFGGVVVSAMAKEHPLAALVTAVIYGALVTSRSYFQLFYNIVFEFTELIAGVIVFTLAVPGLSRLLASTWKRVRAARRRELAYEAPGE